MMGIENSRQKYSRSISRQKHIQEIAGMFSIAGNWGHGMMAGARNEVRKEKERDCVSAAKKLVSHYVNGVERKVFRTEKVH